MSSNSDPAEVVEQVEEILAAWEAYDDTGEFSEIADNNVLAEDAVHIHPGKRPIVGKDDFITFFESLDPSEYDWNHTLEDVVVGRDLVIARHTYRGRKEDDQSGETEKVSGTSVDAFRRTNDGSLKQILSIPSPDD